MDELAKWLEKQCTLHQWVEIHYVVDGYMVQIIGEDERVRAQHEAPTALEALIQAVNAGPDNGTAK